MTYDVGNPALDCSECTKLREALKLCERAASGDPYTIRDYCTDNDSDLAKTGLKHGTPYGIRLNTVGNIVRVALDNLH